MITRHTDADGKQFLSLRPPLPIALGQYWRQMHEFKAPFMRGKTIDVDGQRLVVFHLNGMPGPNGHACSAAKAAQGVYVGAIWKGASEGGKVQRERKRCPSALQNIPARPARWKRK